MRVSLTDGMMPRIFCATRRVFGLDMPSQTVCRGWPRRRAIQRDAAGLRRLDRRAQHAGGRLIGVAAPHGSGMVRIDDQGRHLRREVGRHLGRLTVRMVGNPQDHSPSRPKPARREIMPNFFLAALKVFASLTR